MNLRIPLTLAGLFFSGAYFSHADIVVPGADGSDGALVITEDTTIDLSQAVTGIWDDDNTANAGKGVYDPEKWAVVFKYSSVNIAAGAMVTFANHPSRAPVVWLVNGDVTIDGTVSLDGEQGRFAPGLAEPGPGGFRGGTGYFSDGVDAGAGFGPGGGSFQYNLGFGGSYQKLGYDGSSVYGNPSLVPLIGGSGGGGDGDDDRGGGGGGGAILIASTTRLTVSGQIRANGGPFRNDAGGGSGGGIRLVTDTLAGAGSILALGGAGWGGQGGVGRIRIERTVNEATDVEVQPDPSVIDLASAATAQLWPPNTAPTVKIVSIGAAPVSDDPRASFGTQGADAVLESTDTTQVVIETTNVEPTSQVIVRVTPRSNATFTEVVATRDAGVTADPFRWTADLPVNSGYSAVQVRVVRP